MAKKEKIPKEKKEKKPVERKGASIFEYLSWLTIDKKPWADLTHEEKKGFNVYIINRFLSMELAFTEAINEMQEYTLSMDKEFVWKIYSTILPKERIYLKYIKASEIEGIKQKEIDIFIKHFNCTERNAIEYLNLLKKKNLESEISKIAKNYE